MNTSALKSFAPDVRRQLIEAVGRKLDFVLTGDTADLRAAAAQVTRLRRQSEKDRAGLIDRVAYTWFNRLAALRFLDARGWHPFRARVLTPATAEETQPELLRLTRTGALPAELVPFTDPARLNDLLDGRLPSPDPQGEVYHHLVLAACRFYHDLMPFLFEALDDETELLLPDDLLTEHSVTHGFRTEITDADCAQVEILGWLYQFYISERKAQVMARKSAVPTEDIPAVTQLFTPHWIVRYLVENSLGRLWLLNRPSSRLREHMPYYIEGEAETDFLKITKPEEIRLLDPACGSGHMLTYAFDLLSRIYEEEGHAPSEIPALILRHNLYGLEICPRAAQLAQFALVCKARERSRSAFRSLVQPQVMCLEDVEFTPEEMATYLRLPGLRELFTEKVLRQVHQFRNTATFGSLLQPVLTADEIQTLRSALTDLPSAISNADLLVAATHRKVLRVLDQAEMLCQRYQVVVANPPYMGAKAMNPPLAEFVTDNLPAGKADLYGAFILRNQRIAVVGGQVGMITIPNWMFLSSFESLRKQFLQNCFLTSLLHNGRGVWGGDFGSVAFVYVNRFLAKFDGAYLRLFKRQGEIQSVDQLEANFRNRSDFPIFRASARDFTKIPGSPIAYWIQNRIRQAFENDKIADHAVLFQGIITGDNERYVRQWWEPTFGRLHLNATSIDEIEPRTKQWVPYNKGGESLRWFGNQDLVVNFLNKGRDFTRGKHQFYEHFFKPCFSWTYISSSSLATRFFPNGFIWDVHGSSAFPRRGEDIFLFMSLIASIVGRYLLGIINPTISYQVENIAAVPVIRPRGKDGQRIVFGAKECIELAKRDWNQREISWAFHDQPLLRLGLKAGTLEASWRNWGAQSTEAICRMQALETENNRIWINAYGLQDELTPEVSEEETTLARPDRRKDVAAFLSYVVGCVMGRYSLDKPGLILADAGDTLEHYLTKVGRPLDQLTFAPDADGILPVLDGEWFEDDIVARTRDFLRITFGETTLEANLRFIEESLSKDLRRYFLTDFYKDHLQTYKKRPIYWMFQSPKKGFNALIYLQRYTRDTANGVLNRYLREFLHKLRSRIEHLDHVLASESTPTRDKTRARKESDQLKKTLRECEEYERDILLPLAQQRMELDLDDGVKVNYPG